MENVSVCGKGVGICTEVYISRNLVQHGIVWGCMNSMFKFLHSRNNVNYLIWVS